MTTSSAASHENLTAKSMQKYRIYRIYLIYMPCLYIRMFWMFVDLHCTNMYFWTNYGFYWYEAIHNWIKISVDECYCELWSNGRLRVALVWCLYGIHVSVARAVDNFVIHRNNLCHYIRLWRNRDKIPPISTGLRLIVADTSRSWPKISLDQSTHCGLVTPYCDTDLCQHWLW